MYILIQAHSLVSTPSHVDPLSSYSTFYTHKIPLLFCHIWLNRYSQSMHFTHSLRPFPLYQLIEHNQNGYKMSNLLKIKQLCWDIFTDEDPLLIDEEKVWVVVNGIAKLSLSEQLELMKNLISVLYRKEVHFVIKALYLIHKDAVEPTTRHLSLMSSIPTTWNHLSVSSLSSLEIGDLAKKYAVYIQYIKATIRNSFSKGQSRDLSTKPLALLVTQLELLCEAGKECLTALQNVQFIKKITQELVNDTIHSHKPIIYQLKQLYGAFNQLNFAQMKEFLSLYEKLSDCYQVISDLIRHLRNCGIYMYELTFKVFSPEQVSQMKLQAVRTGNEGLATERWRRRTQPSGPGISRNLSLTRTSKPVQRQGSVARVPEMDLSQFQQGTVPILTQEIENLRKTMLPVYSTSPLTNPFLLPYCRNEIPDTWL